MIVDNSVVDEVADKFQASATKTIGDICAEADLPISHAERLLETYEKAMNVLGATTETEARLISTVIIRSAFAKGFGK